MENNRNYFIAIALSVLIVLGWQFLYMNPRIEAQRKAQEAQKAQQQTEQVQQPGSRRRDAKPSRAVRPLPARQPRRRRSSRRWQRPRVSSSTPQHFPARSTLL